MGCTGAMTLVELGSWSRAADLALLAEALEYGPQTYDWPVTGWSVRDLRELLVHQTGAHK